MQSIEQQLARAGRFGATLAWPAAYAVALGYSVWSWRHRDQIAALLKNKLSWEFRLQMAVWCTAALCAVAFTYTVGIVADRLESGQWRPMRMLGELNRRLIALLGLPFGATLLGEGVETADPLWTALTAVGVALPFAASAYFWRSAADADGHPEPDDSGVMAWWRRAARRGSTVAAWLAVLALWGAYGFLLSRLSIANHHALNTRTIDLGYYDNVFYNSIHGRPLGCSFVLGGTHSSAHFDPILVVLSPLYLFYPHAEMLLVLQSVWLGMGVVPAYLLGASLLKSRWAGVVLAAAYFLYPGLHGANLYEFHSLTLIAPLVLWLVYFFERRRWIGYALMVLLLCLCREDVPLLLCFVGAFAILTGDKAPARAGAITIAFSLLYYLGARHFFMPSKDLLNSGSPEAYSYAYYFDDLMPGHRGVPDMFLSLVTNPIHAAKLALTDPQRILYLLVLFLPLGMLPFFARRARLMLVYGLAVCLLASRRPVFQIGFQYAAMIFPFAFAIVPRGIRDLADDARAAAAGLDGAGLRRGAVWFVLLASLAISFKFGALVENTQFQGGFGRIARWPLTPAEQKEYAELRSLVDLIEPGASVLTTNRIGAHVSNRRDAFLLHQKSRTHYVLFDEREIDRRLQPWHDERVKNGEIVEVKRAGVFVLWRAAKP